MRCGGEPARAQKRATSFPCDLASQSASLSRAVNGTYALLGSCTSTFVAGGTYQVVLRMRDASKHALINGVQCASTTDNIITTAGRAGISAYAASTADTTSTGASWDEFYVTDVAPASALTITTAAVPNAVLTATYATTLSSLGGTGTLTWAISVGVMPPGITLNTATGALSGTPTVAGAYSITARVTDSLAATTTKVFLLTVHTAITVTTTSPLPSAELRSAYTTSVVAAGDEAPYTWALTAGTLPVGITLSVGGVLSGTATTGGVNTFTLRVTGALGSTTTSAFGLTWRRSTGPTTGPWRAINTRA